MFTLSRLPESEMTAYPDSLSGTPHVISARWEGRRQPLKIRTSASSMTEEMPKKPAVEPPQEKVQNLVAMPRRSVSYNDVRDADASRSPLPTKRPETRLDSHLAVVHPPFKSAARLASTDWSDSGSSPAESSSDQPKSFRSDQVLYHSTVGFKQHLQATGRSEENACIGKRTSTERSAGLRRMQRCVVHPATSLNAGPDAILEMLKKQSPEKNASSGRVNNEVTCRTEDGSLDDDDDSFIEDPSSVATWLDYLEERSEVTRKEILYRMGCQRAFLQEARDKLRSHALGNEELRHLWQPKMEDRLAVLRRRCLDKRRKSRSGSRRSCDINNRELVDITFDQVTLQHPALGGGAEV